MSKMEVEKLGFPWRWGSWGGGWEEVEEEEERGGATMRAAGSSWGRRPATAVVLVDHPPMPASTIDFANTPQEAS